MDESGKPTKANLPPDKKDKRRQQLEKLRYQAGWVVGVALRLVVDKLRDATPEAKHADARHEGYVYLFRSGNFYKIGYSKDPQRRLKALNSPDAIKVHVIRTDDMRRLEKAWHARFAHKRHDREWFALIPADVEAFQAVTTHFYRDLAED